MNNLCVASHKLFYDKHIIMQSSVARMHANGLAL